MSKILVEIQQCRKRKQKLKLSYLTFDPRSVSYVSGPETDIVVNEHSTWEMYNKFGWNTYKSVEDSINNRQNEASKF